MGRDGTSATEWRPTLCMNIMCLKGPLTHHRFNSQKRKVESSIVTQLASLPSYESLAREVKDNPQSLNNCLVCSVKCNFSVRNSALGGETSGGETSGISATGCSHAAPISQAPAADAIAESIDGGWPFF
jgi:hypothetical protein